MSPEDKIIKALAVIGLYLKEINDSLKELGTRDADTNLGALELVAKEIHDLRHSIEDGQ